MLFVLLPSFFFFFFLMIRRPPRSTLFPTRRSSDLTMNSRGPLPVFFFACSISCGSKRRLQLKKKDRKSTRLNSSHVAISYAVFCLKKKKKLISSQPRHTYPHNDHTTHFTPRHSPIP